MCVFAHVTKQWQFTVNKQIILLSTFVIYSYTQLFSVYITRGNDQLGNSDHPLSVGNVALE